MQLLGQCKRSDPLELIWGPYHSKNRFIHIRWIEGIYRKRDQRQKSRLRWDGIV